MFFVKPIFKLQVYFAVSVIINIENNVLSVFFKHSIPSVHSTIKLLGLNASRGLLTSVVLYLFCVLRTIPVLKARFRAMSLFLSPLVTVFLIYFQTDSSLESPGSPL